MNNYRPKAVEMRKITKKFGDFTANDSIDLTVHKGEVHALLGENGAGKSTLMNVLYGLYSATSGDILINEKECRLNTPNDAINQGIGMVHQHFMLVKPFTVTENIVLGMEPKTAMLTMNMKKAEADVKRISEKYGLIVDPKAKVQDISVGMEQRVEILKALYRGAEILILDEPTAVLTPQEIRELMQILRNLTNEGKTIILISHKLKEIKEAADYCTIIRRGKKINTVKVADVTQADLAAMMVGREVNFKVDKKPKTPGKKILEIKNLIVKDNRGIKAVNGLNLELHKGEILGIAGIDGNGQSELVEALTGLRNVCSGDILMNGENIKNKTPFEIFHHKISSIPEDRQKHGLVLDFDVSENLVLENHEKSPFAKKGILQHQNIASHARNLIDKFDIRPVKCVNKNSRSLSGGNQQKVIIAREVTNDPQVLIAVQPTRGLDVGAIEYVHSALVKQRDDDKAVLLVSLELDEVMNVSDRIAVIYEGKIVDIIPAEGADMNEIGLMMAGGKD